MVNHIAAVISLMFLSIYVMFSYELVTYQKNVNEALTQTNNIVLLLQENGYLKEVVENNQYFKSVELESFEKDTYIQYSLTTIKHYRCDISFFKFSNRDIVTTISFCTNI